MESTAETTPHQLMAAPCPTCGSPSANAYVYALGRIEPRFPSPGVEKEFAQVDRADADQGKDRPGGDAGRPVRSVRIATWRRQLCWVLTLQGLETYLLTPRDPVDLDLLIDAVRGHTATDRSRRRHRTARSRGAARRCATV